MSERPLRARVTQEVAEVIATRRVGAYQHLTLVAPGVAELARPGQFVALAVGGATSGTLLRRSFSIHKVSPSGTYGGTVDIVVVGRRRRHAVARRAARRTTRSTSSARSARPFPLPTEPVACVLVGGGYGSAPLFWLAEQLRERGCHVEMVLGAATEDRLFGVVEARRSGRRRHRDDRRRLARAPGLGLRRAARRHRAHRRGGRLRLRPDGACCARSPRSPTAQGAVAQVAVEESMACGVGVCMTCVMPVVGDDGADPDGALVRRGAGLPRRPRAAGTPSDGGHRPRCPDDAVGRRRHGRVAH